MKWNLTTKCSIFRIIPAIFKFLLDKIFGIKLKVGSISLWNTCIQDINIKWGNFEIVSKGSNKFCYLTIIIDTLWNHKIQNVIQIKRRKAAEIINCISFYVRFTQNVDLNYEFRISNFINLYFNFLKQLLVIVSVGSKYC